jgi:hypothetical protein
MHSAGAHAASLAAATSAELERLDWRLAVGEVATNLRRELADKASREEVYSAVRSEIDRLDQRVSVRFCVCGLNGYLFPRDVVLVVQSTRHPSVRLRSRLRDVRTRTHSVCLSQYVQKAVDGAASAEGISKVDAELTALKHKVAGELIGARYVLRLCVLCLITTLPANAA